MNDNTLRIYSSFFQYNGILANVSTYSLTSKSTYSLKILAIFLISSGDSIVICESFSCTASTLFSETKITSPSGIDVVSSSDTIVTSPSGIDVVSSSVFCMVSIF